ncbi:AGE family epimerase/isomerase [Streptomyces sp. NPDC047097]|uniref:AGE family epimerase/isomerase n=1 Tax=Streptomyces sp. NPDC047097 TaxID=3155260 RepID=UPI0033FF0170
MTTSWAPPAGPDFSFSDTVAGYVVEHRGERVELRTLDNRPVTLHLTGATHAQRLRNLAAPYQDVTGTLADQLTPGVLLFSYGPVYPDPDGPHFQTDRLVIVGDPAVDGPGEAPGWWTDQLRALAGFYRRSQFGGGRPDFAAYRTEIRSSGEKASYGVQETDTISRLVYGMATTYLLTGDDECLDIAEAGSRYLHEQLRFHDEAADVVHWYHGIDKQPLGERKLFASEFGDEHRSLPAYEQIYALVGLAQTYRITGDPVIRQDLEGTVRLFEEFFADRSLGGYYSHIDPVTLSPHEESLGPNRSRKNWNSVGDHAPAYLINLYLATGEERHLRMLEHTFDMIVTHMPDRTDGGSPFVDERFHADWSPDHSWGWQQDHAVVGHNLKIAWNLLRMQSALPKREYRALAERLGRTLPAIARDAQRGGWYDLMERQAVRGRHAFAQHDRKTWWQQEQAVLAYLLLAAHTGDETFLRHAREASAFYNAFFLDHDAGAVHFTVLAQGIPYAVGNEQLKGSHAMSMYHKAELCFLAETYTRLLIRGEPLDLWFKPRPDADFGGRVLRVAPDLLPEGRVVLERVLIDGEPWTDFDAEDMSVRLPPSDRRLTVRVRLRPTAPSPAMAPRPEERGPGR